MDFWTATTIAAAVVAVEARRRCVDP